MPPSGKFHQKYAVCVSGLTIQRSIYTFSILVKCSFCKFMLWMPEAAASFPLRIPLCQTVCFVSMFLIPARDGRYEMGIFQQEINSICRKHYSSAKNHVSFPPDFVIFDREDFFRGVKKWPYIGLQSTLWQDASVEWTAYFVVWRKLGTARCVAKRFTVNIFFQHFLNLCMVILSYLWKFNELTLVVRLHKIVKITFLVKAICVFPLPVKRYLYL